MEHLLNGLGPFIRDLRTSLRGGEHDYTSGNTFRALTLLAIPMILEVILESVFAVVDVFFVARLGPAAIATVGLTEAVYTLVFATAIGLSMATTAMIARRIGEKNIEGARIAAVQALLLGLMVSLPFSLIGVLFPGEILELLGASSEVVAIGKANTAVMLGGSSTLLMLFLVNAIFRGAGNPGIAMRSLWLASLCNIVLDPCFIFGWGPFPEMGVTGAAVATTLGRGIGVVYVLRHLFRGDHAIRIRRLTIDLPVLGRLFRISVGGVFQWLIATSSWIAVVRVIAVFGDQVLAGYTIGVRILTFALFPAWGLCNASATLVGQNLGADQPKRAEHSVWIAAIYNMVFLGTIGLIFIIYTHNIIGLFTEDPMVLEYGVRCLRTFCYGFLFIALGMVMIGSFNGAGDTVTPTIANFFCYWIFQIPMAYLLAQDIVVDFGQHLRCNPFAKQCQYAGFHRCVIRKRFQAYKVLHIWIFCDLFYSLFITRSYTFFNNQGS